MSFSFVYLDNTILLFNDATDIHSIILPAMCLSKSNLAHVMSRRGNLWRVCIELSQVEFSDNA